MAKTKKDTPEKSIKEKNSSGNKGWGKSTSDENIKEKTTPEHSTPKEQAQGAPDATLEQPSPENEYKQLAQRIQADFDNHRKRNAALRTEALQEGKTDGVLALLPVLDSMQAALKIYREKGEAELQEGYEKLIQQFLAQLQTLGVSPIESENLPFDPNFHEAILQQPQEGIDSGNVAQVYREGYRMGDRVIRHAQVIVAE